MTEPISGGMARATRRTPGQGGPLIVGIGASAGGLEAFQGFVQSLPPDHDMVVVLVQHLDPDHESLMPELITKRTASPVRSVEDGMRVEPGHIYLMPPAYEMDVEEGVLRLIAFEHPRGLRRPINRFFRSLARDAGENAVAIVLSGTGSDGTEGVEAVQEAGGVVLVQDPKEAKYDGMPRSVIDARAQDMILPVAEMADVIRDHHDLRRGAGPAIRSDGEVLDRILRHVKYRTGHDFSGYKKGTVVRRITVRMSAFGIDAPRAYLQHLVSDAAEAKRLFQDLLINVTSFFRDPDAFEVLAKSAIPSIVEGAETSNVIRVWVPGCSTGPEAYSVAILILEELERTRQFATVTVFGTDIDTEALQVGRTGRYSQDLADQVPEQFLRRYFTTHPGGYEVSDRLREVVRFSRHDFTRDPPFASIDLICCRNVLIYMGDDLQELAMRVFHYSLRPGGWLFIGPAENPRSIGAHFEEREARERIYARNHAQPRPLNMPWSSAAQAGHQELHAREGVVPGRVSDVMQALTERHLPPYIHLGAGRDVRHASEGAIRYLRLKAGSPRTQLLDLVRDEVARPFRSILSRDFDAEPCQEIEHTGELDGAPLRFALAAERLEDGSILLVIRDRLDLVENRPGSPSGAGADMLSYVYDLEARLDDARNEISSTVEELETSNEELKSSNEEMMSMNEELQSANEELTTMNDELQESVRALKQANDDLGNFMRSADVAIVFLTKDLRIRAFSPKATEIFAFDEGDQGRPAAEFASVIDMDAVIEMCRLTIEDRKDRVETFESRDGARTLRVRVTPYVDHEDRVEGVAFAVDDTTDLVEAVERAERERGAAELALEEIEQLYAVSPQAMTLVDRDMRYLRINPKMAEINGYPPETHIGKTIREMVPGLADATEGFIHEVLATGEPIAGREVVGRTASNPNEDRTWETDWFPIRKADEISAVGINVRDVTEQTATAANLRLIMHELEHRVKNMLGNVTALVSRAKTEATADRAVYDKLVRRIEGLAKTHALLTAERWSSAPIRSVLQPETAGVYGQERVTLRGPDLRINAQAVLGLGMAVHELATNAAKYGAFGDAGGHVTLSWKRVDEGDGDRLILTWQERGGPPVEEPAGRGFGSRLIESTVAGSLGGEVAFDWAPEGLTCTLVMGFEDVTGAPNPDG
jgi:two-component system CheB/CheR fusion protein